ncbi:MAG TPA: PIN domain-containing protein [Microthrixaceae bacterium]|nr:PIN domain-containing protein [Microthrixaceae bacterium]
MLLVDTNVLLAAADTSTVEHQRCAALLDERADLAITTPVATECSWMIESRLGPRAEAAFVISVATGDLPVIELATADWARCAELIDTYSDLRLGLVDASVIAVAERLDVNTIATMNHRDFAVVRPAHCPAFELIP